MILIFEWLVGKNQEVKSVTRRTVIAYLWTRKYMVYCFLKRETTSSLFVRGHSFPPEGSRDYDPNGKNISEEILVLMKKIRL